MTPTSTCPTGPLIPRSQVRSLHGPLEEAVLGAKSVPEAVKWPAVCVRGVYGEPLFTRPLSRACRPAHLRSQLKRLSSSGRLSMGSQRQVQSGVNDYAD